MFSGHRDRQPAAGVGRRDNAIDRGLLDPTLTEGVVAAHTIGPNLYERLLDRHDIAEEDVKRTIDAFLTGFAR